MGGRREAGGGGGGEGGGGGGGGSLAGRFAGGQAADQITACSRADLGMTAPIVGMGFGVGRI